MKWEKLGRIFDPAERAPWMVTHAANPVAKHLEGDRYRIYCCGRDADGRSQIGYIEICLSDPTAVLAFSEEPFIALGPVGAYDDCGVINACIVERGGTEYHYFSGLTLCRSVPFVFFAGVAISTDGGKTARKVSPSPMLERNEIDPYLTGSPCVLFDDGRWRMWYSSGVRWTYENGSPKHYYHVKYAESDDGLRWKREGKVAVDFIGDEYVVARPCVIRDADLYRMWYSYRGDAYRIGYAESADGNRWIRKDAQAGIDVSDTGWDAEMVCYAHVFDHGGERFMLYNGNDYGKTGIGLARLQR
jgi:hypothetical protein